MKFFKKLALKGLLSKVVKGTLKVADKTLIGGVIHNVIEETKVSKSGSMDWSKLIRTILASTIPVILLIALLKGWITIDELKSLLKLF